MALGRRFGTGLTIVLRTHPVRDSTLLMRIMRINRPILAISSNILSTSCATRDPLIQDLVFCPIVIQFVRPVGTIWALNGPVSNVNTTGMLLLLQAQYRRKVWNVEYILGMAVDRDKRTLWFGFASFCLIAGTSDGLWVEGLGGEAIIALDGFVHERLLSASHVCEACARCDQFN